MKKIVSFIQQKRVHFSVSTSLFITIVAIYQATLLNIAYYRQILMRLSLDGINNFLFFISMPVVVFCVIFALFNLLYFRWLIKLVALFFVLVGAPLTYFMLKFSIVIDRGMLRNVLETNQAESFALMTPSLVMYVLLLGILPALLILLIKIANPCTTKRYFLYRLTGVIVSLMILVLLAAFLYMHYAAFMRNNNVVLKYLMPSNYISGLYSEYSFQKYKNLPFLTIGDDAHIEPNRAETKKTVLVLIVGETARNQNFSLNGYPKETNALLAKRSDVISFVNTSSCGTYTAYSVPCMFSNMTRNSYDESWARRQENVLDILNKTGIDVSWYDNDSGCKGVCDRVFNQDSTKNNIINNKMQCVDGDCYDGILLTDLQQQLERADDNSLIILHMIGSHGPTYYQRYPDEFKKFTPTCDTKQINNCDTQELVNTYDNTLVYTDYIIDQTITQLQGYQDRFNVGVIYISDHGESLGENGVYLHSLPYSIAPEFQTKVPFIMWLSSDYQAILNIDYQCLANNAKQKQYSQDYLFHTLLKGFSVQTKEYQPQLDVFTACQITG